MLAVVLLLSVACCALAHPNPSQDDFTSVFEDADPAISDSAADQLAAEVETLVSMLARGPRKMLLAAPAAHTNNATSYYSKSPQPSDVPLSPTPTEGDRSAVLPACKNITEMTAACSAALQAQQSRTVMIIVIVCAVGAFLVIGVIAYLVWSCIRSNQQLPPQKFSTEHEIQTFPEKLGDIILPE
ncbi:g5038 [Coccomyxa elongata]